MGWNRGKEWKIREKLHYSFWTPLFCFLRWAKHHKNNFSKRINHERISHSPRLRKCVNAPHLRVLRTCVRAPSNSDVDFLLSQVSHSPFLRPLVLDFFSHFLTIASSVPTLTNKRYVVFNKTTRCFSSNDTSFYIKHHVFFPFIWTHTAHISKWML